MRAGASTGARRGDSPGGMASTGAGAGAGAHAQSSRAGAGAQASGSASSSARCAAARAATARHTRDTWSACVASSARTSSVGPPSTAARAALQRATAPCARSRGASLTSWDRCASASRARVDATTASARSVTARTARSQSAASGPISEAASPFGIAHAASRRTQLAAWQIAMSVVPARNGPRRRKSRNAARAAGTFDSHPQRAFAATRAVASFAIN